MLGATWVEVAVGTIYCLCFAEIESFRGDSITSDAARPTSVNLAVP